MMDLGNAALVTHQGCMDGSACAIVFVAAGGLLKNVRFVGPNHRHVDEVVSDLLERWPGPIILADISVSFDLAKKVGRSDVFLFDHHKSAIPLAEFGWCEIDKANTRCGSKILHEWLGKECDLRDYENLITVVDDYDRWIRNYRQSDTLAVFHEDVLGQELFVKRFLRNSSLDIDLPEQYAINLEIEKRNKYIERKKKNLTIVPKNIDGHDVRIAFVSSTTHRNMLGDSICSDPSLGVDIAVIVGDPSVSLRASHTCPIDLSAVAKVNGGGGHAKAAGLSLDYLLGKSLLELVIDKLKFKP